ncbi:MAG TPA: GNAT family N-acetyltransferase [Fimbriimonadaceae bacterium]|nr:GNAT family N-acetyltransferase [Fimbriimonadaceae bacterium]
MDLDGALKVFYTGFCTVRSFAYPYRLTRVGDLSILRDAPRAKGRYRSEEIFIHGLSPEEALIQIGHYSPKGNPFLCVILPDGEPESPLRAYNDAGWRLMQKEPIMTRQTRGFTPSDLVSRVRTEDQATFVQRAARRRQLLPEHLSVDYAAVRTFAVFDKDIALGWVSSIRSGEEAAWVANLFVQPEHRGRGLGEALMSTLLADDHRLGIRHSVLAASTAGERLYTRVGYRSLGKLYLFCPRRGRERTL